MKFAGVSAEFTKSPKGVGFILESCSACEECQSHSVYQQLVQEPFFQLPTTHISLLHSPETKHKQWTPPTLVLVLLSGVSLEVISTWCFSNDVQCIICHGDSVNNSPGTFGKMGAGQSLHLHPGSGCHPSALLSEPEGALHSLALILHFYLLYILNTMSLMFLTMLLHDLDPSPI